MSKILWGGCLCGAVRYRISAEPVDAIYCHCRMCRQAHGAPVVAWLTVPVEGFAIAAGEPKAYRSSEKAVRHFCGDCGAPLTWRLADNPRYLDVSLVSLDTPEDAPPRVHLWTESRLPWFDTADALPRYPTAERPKNY